MASINADQKAQQIIGCSTLGCLCWIRFNWVWFPQVSRHRVFIVAGKDDPTRPEPTAESIAIMASASSSEAIDENKWACGACTYHNSKSLRICEMCGTPNPNCNEPDNTTWVCPACTVRNPYLATVCQVCATTNPKQNSMDLEWFCDDCGISNRTMLCGMCQAQMPSAQDASSFAGRC